MSSRNMKFKYKLGISLINLNYKYQTIEIANQYQ